MIVASLGVDFAAGRARSSLAFDRLRGGQPAESLASTSSSSGDEESSKDLPGPDGVVELVVCSLSETAESSLSESATSRIAVTFSVS